MKKILFLSFIVMIGLAGCTQGEQGDIGPAGAEGLKGLQGSKGETGNSGTLGMLSSDWITVKGTEWKKENTTNKVYSYKLFWPSLTRDILNKGDIHIYFKGSEQKNVAYKLPYLFTSPMYRILWISGLYDGNPGITLYQEHESGLTFNSKDDFAFRIVAVPSSASGRVANLNWSNYEEVKEALELND